MTYVICGDTKDSDGALYNKASPFLQSALVRLHLYPQKLEQTTIFFVLPCHTLAKLPNYSLNVKEKQTVVTLILMCKSLKGEPGTVHGPYSLVCFLT